MPIHDWSCVDPGIFHDFHQAWTIEIRNALNAGGLPPGFFAMAEQILAGPNPDVVTLQRRAKPGELPRAGGGVAVADSPPKARFITTAEVDLYAGKANRIVIRHGPGQVLAVLEIVSPGNKGSGRALRSFVRKTEELLRQGINLLVIDLFRLPHAIRKAFTRRFGTSLWTNRSNFRPTNG